MTAIGEFYNCGPAGDCSGGSDIGVYIMVGGFVLCIVIAQVQAWKDRKKYNLK